MSSKLSQTAPTTQTAAENKPLTALHVKGLLVEGAQAAFYEATLNNARNSILEDGVVRFDLLRGIENANEFLLVEVYKDASDHGKHRLTPHYNEWRPTVEPFMAQDRSVTKYETIFPEVSAWTKSESSSKEDLQGYTESRPWHAAPFESSTGSDSKHVRGGLLVRLMDAQVAAEKAQEFELVTKALCAVCLRESGVQRMDLLRSIDNNTPDANQRMTKYRIVKVFNSPSGEELHEGSSHYQVWRERVLPYLMMELATESYTTLFPSPLYFHKPSTLIYGGEGQVFVQEQTRALRSGDNTATEGDSVQWAGHRGLSTTNLASGMFGFQGPKILMGRGIAGTAVRDLLTNLKLKRPLIVTGSSGLKRNAALFAEVFHSQGDNSFDITAHAVSIDGEPTVEDVVKFVSVAITQGCDSVLSVGGGSALDAGKAVAALIPNHHRSIFDFLEVIGKGLPLEYDPLPFIAVPTTSGTGSEATKNAVLKSRQYGLKVSIRHEKMFPVAAVLDPTLTLSCPPSVTAHVGMDTLCQVVEPYLCCTPNPFVDALAKEGIVRASRSLRDAVADGATNLEAREDMAVASVMGGLCLANAKLGAVHGFAAVLGGRFENAPHGAICACLLPFVFEKNAQCLQEKAATGNEGSLLHYSVRLDALVKLVRFQEVSRMMTGNSTADVAEGVRWLHGLMRDINIPSLSVLCPELGSIASQGTGARAKVSLAQALENQSLQAIITATMNASSTKGNPIVLTREQLTEVLLQAL
eukprot:gene9805-11513_t